jgi:hypothetical protein
MSSKDASGREVRDVLGNNQTIQVRGSGTFYLQGDVRGHDNCDAVPKPGKGGSETLPIKDKMGGDTFPFRSPGVLHFTAIPNGRSDECFIITYRSSNGAEVDFHQGTPGDTETWDVSVSGEVWVESDVACKLRITGSPA